MASSDLSPVFAATRAYWRENRGVTAIARQRVPVDCRDGLIFEVPTCA